MPRYRTTFDHIMERLHQSEGPLSTPCWVTSYVPKPDGYVQLRSGDKQVNAHRVTYEHFVGPIAAGLQLDHLCRVRHCVNPAHLEAVTPQENVRRSLPYRDYTSCRRGHSMENAYKNGKFRSCRVCRDMREGRLT